MGLYAIGDLHLSIGSDKPMDVFGGGWSNYVDKIRSGFETLGPDDICVVCGDISWGMSLEESLEDFIFFSALPGKKIILKGNHDYWWSTVKKMKAFFAENGIGNIDILHNNCFYYEGSAICGTRGWILDMETESGEHAKITAREAGRLRASLAAAGHGKEKLCFFHYPPRFKDTVNAEIVSVMDDFGVKKCWYGHIHGHGHRLAVRGMVDGIDYEMVSADFIGFTPIRIM